MGIVSRDAAPGQPSAMSMPPGRPRHPGSRLAHGPQAGRFYRADSPLAAGVL